MRLIDKDYAVNTAWSIEAYHGSAREVCEMLEDAPTVELIRCKDCKHFETDHFENINGIPLIVAHEICVRWGDGCKTSSDGYCFMAERKEE